MGIKEEIKASPDGPGIYLFKDKDNRIIYIGKAASVRKRVKSHFSGKSSSRHEVLIRNTAAFEYILTPDEPTALILEAALIKRYMPKYNVLLKDDKRYPRLKLTVNEEYPRLILTRKVKPDGALYFGPYTDAKLLRKALKALRRAFPLRTCAKIPKKGGKRACLDFHIGQCIGPCLDNGRRSGYKNIVEELKLFLEGRQKELMGLLACQMKRSAEERDYERAAGIRDRMQALSVLSKTGRSHDESLCAGSGREAESVRLQAEELASILKLPCIPRIIEVFDVSNTSGKGAVGSMVCFADGKPKKNRYLHFRIKTVNAIDDYSMMREIVSRRYKRLLSQKEKPPELIIIDGGKGHLAAAKAALRPLRIAGIPVIGIAKNPDKIYVHEKKGPMLLGRFSQALLFCKRARDEAHRFAISYHRALRRKGLSLSELDNIRGVGPKRKAELIRYFGSLDKIKKAGIDELRKADFVDEKEARAIYDYFR